MIDAPSAGVAVTFYPDAGQKGQRQRAGMTSCLSFARVFAVAGLEQSVAAAGEGEGSEGRGRDSESFVEQS